MSAKDKEGQCIFCLVEKGWKVRELDAFYLKHYIDDGCATYYTAEEAEEGRQRGDAYDEPGKTRVVGFRIIPYLPKKNKKKKTKEKTNEI